MRKWVSRLLLTGAALPVLFAAACVPTAGEEGQVQAPWPTPTAPAHPVTLADVHCFSCHNPASPRFTALSSSTSGQAVSHPLEQREDCLVCHATRAPYPFSESHDVALNQACLLCHTPGKFQ